MKRVLIVGLAVTVAAAGCATEIRLVAQPDTCKLVEARSNTGLTTAGALVCWDADGRVIASGVVPGKPVISVPLELIGGAAPVVGAGVLGAAIKRGMEAQGQAGQQAP